MDFPGVFQTPTHIHTWTIYAIAQQIRQIAGVTVIPANITWHAANDAHFIPIVIPFPYPVQRVFWCNGSGTLANVDFGIYSFEKARIFSLGSTAQSGASVIQYAAVTTPFVLSAGTYYFALSCSAANASGLRGITPAGGGTRLTGLQRQATAHPLPSPGVPTATPAGSLNYPLIGITRLSSGF